MKTEFDPQTHIGKVDGVIWPSVTQLLNEFKLVDFDGVSPERLYYKRILGTRVHAATVLLDNGSLDEEHFNASFPECVPYLDAYRKFREIEDFEPLRKEDRYFSKKWRFHGQPDESGLHICKISPTENALVDYKCTFACYPATGPQLSGYEILILECLGIKIKKRFGLLLKPTGHYDLIPFKDPNDKQDFLACLWLWWQRVNKYKTLNPKKMEASNEQRDTANV